MAKELTHMSLFAGIGGIDIAAEWAGFKTILFCEIDEYCQKVLTKHWPDVPIISDVRDVNIDTIANICYNNGGGKRCEYVANVGKNQQCQGKLGKDTCVENATINTKLNGEIKTEGNGENTQTVGKKNREIKSLHTTGENVFVVEKQLRNFSPLTTKTTTEAMNAKDTIISKCGKSLLNEDIQTITKSSAITVTTQKKSMEFAPTNESEDVKDVTKEKIMAYTESNYAQQFEVSNGGREGQVSQENRLGLRVEPGRYGTRGITLITGGFPCQPFSVAGKRRGKDDNRYLWPEMLRVIKEFKPTWVCCENVVGIVNMALDTVCSDLEAEGYEVQPIILPACGVNAPHRRYRVFIVAHSTGKGRGEVESQNGITIQEIRQASTGESIRTTSSCDVTDSDINRQQQPKGNISEGGGRISNRGEDVADTKCKPRGYSEHRGCEIFWGKQAGGSLPGRRAVESELGRETDGIPRILDDAWAEGWETNIPRVATGVRYRVDRLRCLGNAVVPQQIYPILKAIAEIELCYDRKQD